MLVEVLPDTPDPEHTADSRLCNIYAAGVWTADFATSVLLVYGLPTLQHLCCWCSKTQITRFKNILPLKSGHLREDESFTPQRGIPSICGVRVLQFKPIGSWLEQIDTYSSWQ
jgi:hypothetical protein